MNLTFYKPSLNILFDEIITNANNQLKNIETKEKNNFFV